MKRLVIFDLDGTLVNSIDDLGTATNAALERGGFNTHPICAYPNMVGNGVRRLIERALPTEARHDTALIDRLLGYFREYYDSHLYEYTRPYEGIPALLDDLSAAGIGIAVASNKYESAARRLIEHLFGDYNWTAVCGQTPDVPVKPDPSIVFRILAEHPTPKADVLYVGDSGVDMETARRAGVDSCGVTWGFRPRSELEGAYADHIVDYPAAILDLVK